MYIEVSLRNLQKYIIYVCILYVPSVKRDYFLSPEKDMKFLPKIQLQIDLKIKLLQNSLHYI